MIAALAQLFVERVDVPAPRALASARRLLVVDATGRAERVGKVLEALQRIAPASCSLVALDDVATLSEAAPFEVVWLLSWADTESDYEALIVGELARRFPGSHVEQIGAASFAAGVLEGGLPWRRRSAIEASARLLAERLES